VGGLYQEVKRFPKELHTEKDVIARE